MKTLFRTVTALALLGAIASPALASETCIQLARAIFTADPSFPQIVDATAQELEDWPESCAATPPTGEGKLVQICTAQTAEAPIYFWLKEARNAQTLGFEPCAG
jgi:hypothetical protein